jgi:hypothetical protein
MSRRIVIVFLTSQPVATLSLISQETLQLIWHEVDFPSVVQIIPGWTQYEANLCQLVICYQSLVSTDTYSDHPFISMTSYDLIYDLT